MAETIVKGPNKIVPAESYVSIDRNDAVKLRIGDDEISGRDPISVPGLLNRTARDYPDHPALIFKNSTDTWETTTYLYVYIIEQKKIVTEIKIKPFRQYKAKVHHMAKVFIKLGLKKSNAVAILAFNSPEWFVSELAAIHAGYVIIN